MQGTHEWFLLTDNHVSFSSKLGTLTLILYILQFLPSVKKTSKWETKLEACFPHIYFSRSHHQKCEILCVSVCLCMMGIKLSVLPMLNKHSCTELHPKARNVEILWYLLTMGSLSREGSCWLPNSATFPGHKPSHFQLLRSWGIHSSAPDIRDTEVLPSSMG